MSFDIAYADQKTARLTSAILLYGQCTAGYSSSTPCYATVHPVEHSTDGPVIRAGSPVTREALLSMADSLAGASRLRHGLLPPEVLCVGPDYLAWWVRPAVRNIFFDSKGALGRRSGPAPHPGLVFAVRHRDWYVVAVKGDERPTADTPIFHAPYMNVWSNAGICTGNVSLPANTLTGRISAWNDAFFKSNFSHPNHDRAVKFRGGLDAFWRSLLDDRPATFPERVMVRRDNETVGGFIDMIEGGRL